MVKLAGFNANDVDPSFGFKPMPQGDYTAIIIESDSKPTKDGSGSYLELTFQVVEGEFNGRNIWARLNLENKNDTAVDMARAELSAICHAVNVMQPNDSTDLHNLPLILTVGLEKRKDTGEFTNIIKEYKPKSQYGMQQQNQQQFQQPGQQNQTQQNTTNNQPVNQQTQGQVVNNNQQAQGQAGQQPGQPPQQQHQQQTYDPNNPGPSPYVNNNQTTQQPPQPQNSIQQPQNQTQQLQPQQ